MLPAHLLIDAIRRRLESEGHAVYVRHRGDEDRGTIMVVTDHRDGFGPLRTGRLWRQQRDLDGNMDWFAPKGEADLTGEELETLITRAREDDPDLWVVEVEGRFERCPFAVN